MVAERVILKGAAARRLDYLHMAQRMAYIANQEVSAPAPLRATMTITPQRDTHRRPRYGEEA